MTKSQKWQTWKKNKRKRKHSFWFVRQPQEKQLSTVNYKIKTCCTLWFRGAETDVLTTNTSPVAMSLSTTNQASLCPPILALWPSVRVNQPGWTETHRKTTREGTGSTIWVVLLVWNTNSEDTHEDRVDRKVGNRKTEPPEDHNFRTSNNHKHTFVCSHDGPVLNGDKVPWLRFQIL